MGGETGENNRSAICGALSSMHDNQLLSVQFFKCRVGLDQCLRYPIDPASSTAQGLRLQRSARNLQDKSMLSGLLSALSVVSYTCLHSHWVFRCAR